MTQAAPEKLTTREVASLLGCCRGRIGKLVWQGKLPPADDGGYFDRAKLYGSKAWRERKC